MVLNVIIKILKYFLMMIKKKHLGNLTSEKCYTYLYIKGDSKVMCQKARACRLDKKKS